MNKLIFLISIILLATACKNEPKLTIPANWQTLKYTIKQPFVANSNFEIELSAPNDWQLNNELKEDDLFPPYLICFPKGAVITPGQANEAISVACTALPMSMDADGMIKQLNELTGANSLKVENKKSITINGHKCESFTMDSEGIINYFYFFQKPKTTLMFSFNSTNRKLMEEKSIVMDSIIQRFTFTTK